VVFITAKKPNITDNIYEPLISIPDSDRHLIQTTASFIALQGHNFTFMVEELQARLVVL